MSGVGTGMGDPMKYIGMLLMIALAAGLAACGDNPANTTTNPATGAWSETFTSASSQPLGSLAFNMMQDGTALTGSGMNFANLGSLGQCFGSGTVMSGQMGTGKMNGGSMTMT